MNFCMSPELGEPLFYEELIRFWDRFKTKGLAGEELKALSLFSLAQDWRGA